MPEEPLQSTQSNRSLAAALFFLLIIPGIASAGAWTQPKGTLYAKMAANYFRSTAGYDRSGGIISVADNGSFEDFNVTWYQEYGLLENFTIIASLPYKTVRFEDDLLKSDTYGLGDIDVAGRLRIVRKPVVVSLQALVKLPWAYDRDEQVPIGNGQVDLEGRLLVGRSLHPLPAYAGLELGYRHRDGDPSDEFRYLAEFGYTFVPRLSARVKLDGTLSVENGNDTGTGLNSTLTNEYDLGKLEVTTSFLIRENLFLECTWTPTVYGENTSQGHTFSLALAGTFRPKAICSRLRGEKR